LDSWLGQWGLINLTLQILIDHNSISCTFIRIILVLFKIALVLQNKKLIIFYKEIRTASLPLETSVCILTYELATVQGPFVQKQVSSTLG
jgi:hypothetical protein